jgi:hypothetical protein
VLGCSLQSPRAALCNVNPWIIARALSTASWSFTDLV